VYMKCDSEMTDVCDDVLRGMNGLNDSNKHQFGSVYKLIKCSLNY
jgi:hypothetical protein